MRDAWRLARKAASVVMAARAADTCMACGNTHRAHIARTRMSQHACRERACCRHAATGEHVADRKTRAHAPLRSAARGEIDGSRLRAPRHARRTLCPTRSHDAVAGVSGADDRYARA
ncbi:hypothetical protein GBP346_B0151 [Burkholderia pseudomallei MSHR346]|nr:hypothetical protein BURPS1655_I0130 [Burkholderia pseudomallei 1655]EEP49060.1 hypothetical protein GBP346_B0151 [Burkholderia pseudomallei MSHR346]